METQYNTPFALLLAPRRTSEYAFVAASSIWSILLSL